MVKRTEAERRQLVGECRGSGKPIKAWCREQGIAYSTFTNWLKSFPPEKPPDKSIQSARWAEVKPGGVAEKPPFAAGAPTPVTIRLCGGYEISVGPGFEPGLLTDVLRVVSRICC